VVVDLLSYLPVGPNVRTPGTRWRASTTDHRKQEITQEITRFLCARPSCDVALTADGEHLLDIIRQQAKSIICLPGVVVSVFGTYLQYWY